MSMIGKTLAHYSITAEIGKGGMGEVFLAQDTSLDRKVAIKFLPEPFEMDETAHKRFMREAKSAAALDHPYICSIHEVGEVEGQSYIVMEYVEGQTLKDKIAQGKVPLKDALQWSVEIAEALAVAHEKGIIHRDLKPSNIMISRAGHAKVMDFGLAKQLYASPESGSQEETLTGLTREGSTVGTIPYMSPEQVKGKAVDLRSDLFSFGIVIYEILSGINPFKRENSFSTADAICRETPPSLSACVEDLPQDIDSLVGKLLAKEPSDRIQQSREIEEILKKALNEVSGEQITFSWRSFTKILSAFKKPAYLIPFIIILAGVVYFSVQEVKTYQKGKWARDVAIPEIVRLSGEERFCAALRLFQQSESYLQDNPELENIRNTLTIPATFLTNPPGAEVYVRDYVDAHDDTKWIKIGLTPLESVRIPNGYLVYRIIKSGFDDNVGATNFGLNPSLQITLREQGGSPPGMIWIPAQNAGTATVINTEPVRDRGIEGYWLDRYEVTNRQFKEFVDSNGYGRKEYWKFPFTKEGRKIPWEEAVASFRDTTAQPGPATWEFGTYPNGREDYPVNGVSWYEAAAYAAFAGKSLPTVHHWVCAAGNWPDPIALQLSNFSGNGPAGVGSYGGLSPYGIYDMAGNVKEWCWNPSGSERYILGGAWNDPNYSFLAADVRDPMDRSDINGFRCAKYITPPGEELTGTVKLLIKDRRGDKPVSDEKYQIYKSIHQYDHGDLKEKTESIDDSFEFWRLEKVSFQAAYGNERVTAHLYIPKNAEPPYQCVVHFPGSYAIEDSSIQAQAWEIKIYDFIIRSGRALMYPVYKGTHERSSGLTYMNYLMHTNLYRDIAIDYAKDFGRSLDYLDDRQDINGEKLACYGFSMGAAEAPRLIALEPRIKTGLLFYGGAYEREWPAEVDPFNFAPRVSVPILMLDGKYDVIFSLEASQKPLFQALGTPQGDKKHYLLNAGHGGFNQEVIREALVWLDTYLGPVRTR